MRWTLISLILLIPISGKSLADSIDVLVVLGLPDKVMQDAREAAQRQWGDSADVAITSVSELEASDSSAMNDARVVLTAGVNGCRYVLERKLDTSVLCSLLSQESFERIQQEHPLTPSSALVLDQPLSRQVEIASAVFPALRKFSVLRSIGSKPALIPESTQEFLFDSSEDALATVVTLAVEGTDALIAQPDSEVFNRTTIRTIMLTAYGHGRPMVGYSEAFVRAGALLATFSTIQQTFLHASEILPRFLAEGDNNFGQVYSPRYFSIAVNDSIAKSLQLVQARDVVPGRSWQDGEFPP